MACLLQRKCPRRSHQTSYKWLDEFCLSAAACNAFGACLAAGC
jgi:hypothetical protein